MGPCWYQALVQGRLQMSAAGCLWSLLATPRKCQGKFSYQLKKEKKSFYLSQTEDYKPGSSFSKSSKDLLHVLEVKGMVISILETKNHTSKWHIGILHTVQQGYIVQVNTKGYIVQVNTRVHSPGKHVVQSELGKSAIHLRSYTVLRQKKYRSRQFSGHSHFPKEVWFLWRHTPQQGGEEKTQTNTERSLYSICLVLS